MSVQYSTMSICWFAYVWHLNPRRLLVYLWYHYISYVPNTTKLADEGININTPSANSTRKLAFFPNLPYISTTYDHCRLFNIYSQPILFQFSFPSLSSSFQVFSIIPSHQLKEFFWTSQPNPKDLILSPGLALLGPGNRHWKCFWL